MRLLNNYLHDFAGKRVLVRCNFDVPMAGGMVLDRTRIENTGETLRILLEYGCKLVLLAHYDRPDGWEEDKSLRPVVAILEEMLGEAVGFVKNLDRQLVEEVPARVVLLENLRFWKGEQSNDNLMVKELADLGDFYVNEAFADCHREHASIVGLARELKGVAGLHLAREIQVLSSVRDHPVQPLVVVIGGAKLETKEPLVKAFESRADNVLIGGQIAYDLGKKKIDLTEKMVLADTDVSGKDITEESARRFADIILKARTVIWNGTMGVFEEESHRRGTEIIAEAVDRTSAFTVVGGGDTETALTILNLEDDIDHISSGGGAMLEFLVKGTLPGIEVLEYGE
jgi:phosphoglycerate kinase